MRRNQRLTTNTDEICFNSRTPGGVRRNRLEQLPDFVKFQFTHPGRGATCRSDLRVACVRVSIHAPREGCDVCRPPPEPLVPVSIHAPREGCDLRWALLQQVVQVSIHAPREGCDATAGATALSTVEFQFTHPGRGATTSRPRLSS